MSSLGFHAEHAREKRPRLPSRSKNLPGSNSSSLTPPPPPQQQHYSTYSRSPFVRGSTIGDSSGARKHEVLSPPAESDFGELDPPGLNNLSIGGAGKKTKEVREWRARKEEEQGAREWRARKEEEQESREWRGPKRALQRIEESAIIKERERERDNAGELRQTIDQLRLDLTRESLARKELTISMKSILSDLDQLREELRDRDEEGGGNSLTAEKIQRELRDVEDSWTDKFNHVQKDLKTQNETLLRDVDKSNYEFEKSLAQLNTIVGKRNSELQESLKEVNDMLYWYYGVVKKPDGIDIVSKEDGIRVLHKAKYGETLLLQPPMEKTHDGAIKMSCRMVDEKGQPSIGEVHVAKNDTLFVSSFAMEPPKIARDTPSQ